MSVDSLFDESTDIYPQGLIILKDALKTKILLEFGDKNQMMNFGKFEQFQELQTIGIKELSKVGINHDYFDQFILNRYFPGEGIKPHVDLDRFEDGIVIGCVLGSAMMEFEHVDLGLKFNMYLKENDVIILTESSRFDWTHSIPAVPFDIVNGIKIQRKERHSITLRKMKLNTKGIS